MTALRDTAAAMGVIALFFAAIHFTGEPTEAQAMADVAAEVEALAIEAEQMRAEAEFLVRQHCQTLHGSRALVLRIAAEGHLVCRRRGEVL